MMVTYRSGKLTLMPWHDNYLTSSPNLNPLVAGQLSATVLESRSESGMAGPAAAAAAAAGTPSPPA